MTEFDSKRRYSKLAIAVHVLQIWSLHCTHAQNHCRTIVLLVKPFGDVRLLLKLPFDHAIAQKKKRKRKHLFAALLHLRIASTSFFKYHLQIFTSKYGCSNGRHLCFSLLVNWLQLEK